MLLFVLVKQQNNILVILLFYSFFILQLTDSNKQIQKGSFILLWKILLRYFWIMKNVSLKTNQSIFVNFIFDFYFLRIKQKRQKCYVAWFFSFFPQKKRKKKISVFWQTFCEQQFIKVTVILSAMNAWHFDFTIIKFSN